MNVTLFVVFLNVAGEPLQYEQLEVCPDKTSCMFVATKLQKETSLILRDLENPFSNVNRLEIKYACVMSPAVVPENVLK